MTYGICRLQALIVASALVFAGSALAQDDAATGPPPAESVVSGASESCLNGDGVCGEGCTIAQDSDCSETPLSESDGGHRTRGMQGSPNDSLAIEAQLFTGFRSINREDENFSEFELDRAELGTFYRWDLPSVDHQVGGELRIEGIRSAAPQSVYGVDGDSIVLRVKRAWGYGRLELGPGNLNLRAGLIPDVWKEAMENDYDLRGLSPTLSERGGFFDTSDFGASVDYRAFDDRLIVRYQASNGEGRNQVEQNSGKNSTVVVSGTPVIIGTPRGPIRISLHGVYRDGSLGVGQVQNHRLGAGLTFVAPCPRAGVEFVQATGYQGRADVDATGIGAYANSYLGTHWAGLALRYDTLTVSPDEGDSATESRTTIALYSDLLGAVDNSETTRPPLGFGFDRLRVYGAVQLDRFDENSAAVPGTPEAVDTTRFMLMVSANGYRSFE